MPSSCRLLLPLVALVAAGCAGSGITTVPEQIPAPAEWARGATSDPVAPAWLDRFDDAVLEGLVAEALANNFSLQAERQRVSAARQTVVLTRAGRLPFIDVSLDGSRRETELVAGGRNIADSSDLSAGLRWDADLWRDLSSAQQAAEFELAAQSARLLAQERAVAAATVRQYVDALAATQLLAVAQRRLDIAIASEEIVASGYRQGLNDALDLYLARNQVERERASLALQEQTRLEAIADLQLSLGRYPDGTMDLPASLPVPAEPIPAGLPSELLTRRPDLQQAWLQLLAADADLASAQRARFPRLSLVGSAGLSSGEFSTLLDDGLGAWTLAASLAQPLFDGGRLRALEAQALTRVKIAEQTYLEQVYRAFAEVENALSRSLSLKERFDALLEAEKNSRAALELALEQYRRGLVPYTTVLESQRQAFDAEATVVQLRAQRLQNRVGLYLALGGPLTAE